MKVDSVKLSWKPSENDGGLPIKNYAIEYRDARRTGWVRAGIVPADMSTFTCGNLNEGNDYHFRVYAVNDEGEGDALETTQATKVERPSCK